ncbi:hypothetical protein B0H11DRAFT_1926232 [Mycena galericulata]|nr:hypothetical protein B0H11DRAFT_1926232 [Mycena galericulata]
MSPWCDDDLQDLFPCRRRTAAHWRALEPGAERGTHGHTHTTAHSREGAVGGRTCRARELCRCGAARLGLARTSHAAHAAHARGGFASAARGRLRIRLYQRKGEDISTHSVGLVVPDDRTNDRSLKERAHFGCMWLPAALKLEVRHF